MDETTSANPDGRSPAEIEHDIARTRSQMDDTLSALQHRLSPEAVADLARDYLAEHTQTGREFVENFAESVRRNPVPMALLGISVAWLMYASRGPRESRALVRRADTATRVAGPTGSIEPSAELPGATAVTAGPGAGREQLDLQPRPPSSTAQH